MINDRLPKKRKLLLKTSYLIDLFLTVLYRLRKSFSSIYTSKLGERNVKKMSSALSEYQVPFLKITFQIMFSITTFFFI